MTKSFTFGPNSGAPDLLDAIRDPSRWMTPNCGTLDLDWYHFFEDVEQDRLAPWLGPNTYQALDTVNEFGFTILSQIPKLYISGDACKDHDPTGENALAKWRDVVIPRVEAAGGTLAAITLDEPLTSTVPGRYQPPNHVYPWGPGEVHRVAQYTSRLVLALGLPVVLYEAFPQQPPDRIAAFIRHVHDEVGPLLKRFVLDVDERALLPTDNLEHTAGLLREMCEARGIEFAIAGMAQHGPHETDISFIDSQTRWLQRAAPLTDHLTIESWNEHAGQKTIPSCETLASVLSWADAAYNPKEPMPDLTAEQIRTYVKQSAHDWHYVKRQELPQPGINFGAIGNMTAKRIIGGKSRQEVRDEFAARFPEPTEPSLPPFGAHIDFTTNFLLKGATTLMLRGQSRDQRMRVYEAMHSREFDTLLYYLYNEQDGTWRHGAGAIAFDGLTKNHYTTLKIAQEIKDNGLHGCPILLPDDAPVLNGTRADKVYPSRRRIRDGITQLLPQLDAIMERKFCWAGLELNEYMSPNDVLWWAELINSIVPDWYIGLHYTRGRHGSCPTKDARVSQVCRFTWQGSWYDIEIDTVMDWWKWVKRLTEGKAGLSYQVMDLDPVDLRVELKTIHERSLGGHGWPSFWLRYEESAIKENGAWVSEAIINQRARIARDVGIAGSGHGDNR